MRRSSLPAFRASEFKPQDLSLREGETRLIRCPECSSWHSLKRGLILPHYSESTSRGGRGTRCPGSARRVIMDISVEAWGAALTEGEQQASARRSARQFYKPLPPASEPVSRMGRSARPQTPRSEGRALLTAYERAHQALVLHRSSCSVCRRGGFCVAGQELVRRRALTTETREQARKRQALEERAERTWERRRGEQQARRHAAEWSRVAPGVERTEIQRVRDELQATLQQLGDHLDRFDRARLDSTITALVEKLRRL